jgi:uncharacterized protein
MKTHYPTIIQSIWLLLLFIPLSIILVIPLLVFNLHEKNILLSLVYILLLSSIIFIGFKKRKSFLLPRTGFKPVLLFISFGFLMSFHLVIDPLSGIIPEPEGLIKAIDEMMQYPVLAFITIAIIAPLLEEILFRGIILDGYLKNYSPAKSILISALLFAFIHGNIAQGIGAFVMGIVVGVLYWRTRSLLLCIGLHFVNNFTATLLLVLDPESLYSTQTFRELIEDDTTYWLVYAGSCLLMMFGGWYLWRNYINPAKDLLFVKPYNAPEQPDVINEIPIS